MWEVIGMPNFSHSLFIIYTHHTINSQELDFIGICRKLYVIHYDNKNQGSLGYVSQKHNWLTQYIYISVDYAIIRSYMNLIKTQFQVTPNYDIVCRNIYIKSVGCVFCDT
jgi:hypothetical protein